MLATVIYDGQLSWEAYTILAAMFLIIFGGLGWCFYRALKATNNQAAEQHPDEE